MAEAASLLEVFSRAATPRDIEAVVRVALLATPGVVRLQGGLFRRDLTVRRDKAGKLHIACRMVIEAGQSATVMALRIRDMLERGPFPIERVDFTFTELSLPRGSAAQFARSTAKE